MTQALCLRDMLPIMQSGIRTYPSGVRGGLKTSPDHEGGGIASATIRRAASQAALLAAERSGARVSVSALGVASRLTRAGLVKPVLLQPLRLVGLVLLLLAGCEERRGSQPSAQQLGTSSTTRGETMANAQPIPLNNPPLSSADSDRMLAEGGESLRLSPLARKLVTFRFGGVFCRDRLQIAGNDLWAQRLCNRLAAGSLTQVPATSTGGGQSTTSGVETLAVSARVELSADDSPAFAPRPERMPIRIAVVLYDPTGNVEHWRYEYCCLAGLADLPVAETGQGFSLPTASLTVPTSAGPVCFADATLAALVRVERAMLRQEDGKTLVSLDLTSLGEGRHVAIEATFVDRAEAEVAKLPSRPYYLPADQTVRVSLSTSEPRATTCRISIRRD